MTLTEGAFAVGKRVNDIELSKCGATITAIRRGQQTILPDDFNHPLGGGDVVVLYGKPEALEHGEAVLLRG